MAKQKGCLVASFSFIGFSFRLTFYRIPPCMANPNILWGIVTVDQANGNAKDLTKGTRCFLGKPVLRDEIGICSLWSRNGTQGRLFSLKKKVPVQPNLTIHRKIRENGLNEGIADITVRDKRDKGKLPAEKYTGSLLLNSNSYYMILMTMALAPPPPLQIPAAPVLPPFCFSTLIRVTMILAPLHPSGWPSETAPP